MVVDPHAGSTQLDKKKREELVYSSYSSAKAGCMGLPFML